MKFKITLLTATLLALNACKKESITDNNLENFSSSGTSNKELINICLEKELEITDNGSRTEKTLLIDKLWENGKTIKVEFLSGSESIQNRIWEQAVKWENYANIKFELVYSGDADIRINIDDSNSSWSYIGTDALYVDSESATMNFGWFDDDTSDREFQRTTLHEFGHALGAVHEHQNPAAEIQWDEAAVIEYYEVNFGWSEARVQSNIFDKYTDSEATHSEYDPNSIMNYAIDNSFTLNDFSIEWNTNLSELDKSFIGEIYPFNLALGKETQQSSTYKVGVSSRAVDGNLSGVWSNGSITHTLSEDRPWWQVRLGSEYAIGDINIYNRMDECCIGRLTDFDVFVYNDVGELMYKTRINEIPNPMVTINAGGVIGSRVRVKLSDVEALNLAEVEVFEY